MFVEKKMLDWELLYDDSIIAILVLSKSESGDNILTTYFGQIEDFLKDNILLEKVSLW